MSSSRDSLELLHKLNVNVVSLANNHALDYGLTALEDTMSALSEMEIAYSGAGRNIDMAKKPAIIETNGTTIAVLCYSWTNEWTPPAPAATQHSPGVNPLVGAALKEDVKNAREHYKANRVIVSVHWGKARNLHVAPECVAAGRKIIECGADAVIGHHPHCLQSYEIYLGRPIIYSLGNFIFSQYHEANNRLTEELGELKKGKRRERETVVARFNFPGKGISNLQFLSLVQHHENPVLLTPSEDERRRILARFTGRSKLVAKRTYPFLFNFLHRADIIAKTIEDIKEDGLKDLTWKTPYRMARKLIRG
jgi:poly-gamma-glutamate capsule biosynthesis protein CapA/YwtB (metallophosphatase superfamily)